MMEISQDVTTVHCREQKHWKRRKTTFFASRN